MKLFGFRIEREKLAWGNAYTFELGDVVEIIGEHPMAGRRGVVRSTYSQDQFGIEIDGKETVARTRNLKIV